MKHIVNRIFLFHLFFVSQGLFAQSEQIDSLKQLYANETVDTIKINLSLKIATAYKSTSPDIAFEYINQARQDGLEVDSLNWYSQINQATANIYQHLGEFDHALEYYYKNKFYLDHKKTDTIEDLIIYRRIMNSNNLFLCYNDLGKSQDALDHIFEAIDLLNELKQRNSEHYSTRRYLIILNNLATVYINENEYPKAKQTFLQALELSQNIDDKYFIAIISNNLGIIHMNLKEYDYASLYYKKAEETWIKLKDTSRLIQVYNNLGSYYSMLEDNNKAITYLNKALVLSENQKVYRSAIITVQSLATIYSKNNEFEKALDYHKKFKSLSDSLFNQETSKNIARTEFEYEFLKKQRDKEIEQQKELALKEKRILQIKMFSGITFLIFISGALLFFILRNKNKHSRLKQNHLELEGKHLKLAKENLKHEIQGKNKELTTNVLYLVKKNEFILIAFLQCLK